MAAQKTVLVTGANKGLGLAIIQNAATRDPSCHYFLGCRDTEAGAKAIDELKQKGIVASLELLKLDTTNDADITAAVQHIDKAFGKLDGMRNAYRHD
jgi:NAD(P)-dependent dehydrogenase (short-subunit alcohol dehydrogenase family)